MKIKLPPLLVKLSDSEKKILIILAVVFAFLFVVIGLLVKCIKSWMSNQAKTIDLYLYDLCKYRVLKTPQEVVKYVYRRETKALYLSIRWSIRIFIISAIGFICYIQFAKSGDYQLPLNILKDLTMKLDWPRSEFFGIQMISGWPSIAQSPIVHLNLDGYLTYIMTIITAWMLITLIISTLGFVSKQRRAHKVSVSAFGRSLDAKGFDDE